MAIRITEIEDDKGERDWEIGCPDSRDGVSDAIETLQQKTLKVEGSLYLKDAELLEHICQEASQRTGRPLIVELSQICFLDRASAEVLCRMKRQQGIEIKGMNLFIKKVMELSDEAGTSHGNS